MPYKLNTGFNLSDGKGREKRYEPGNIVDNIDDAETLLARGDIERIETPKKQPKAAPVAPETQE